MSNELEIRQKKDSDIAVQLGMEIDMYRALRYSLFPDDSIPEYAFGLYVAACKAKNYDPLKKPYHIVMMNVNTNPNKKGEPIWEKRPTIMPGIISHRIDAERTGKFMGLSETEYGPMITKRFAEKTVTFPEYAKVLIYKFVNGEKIAIPAKLYWEECYGVAKKGSTIPNDMWSRRPRAQLEKCVHAHGLRLGFSEEIGAMVTPDELREPLGEIMEKDITPQAKRLDSIPLPPPQSCIVDEEILHIHLANIQNSMTWEELKELYNKAKEAVAGHKEAINQISKATKERKEYIRQLKMTEEIKPESSTNSEFLAAYEERAQI